MPKEYTREQLWKLYEKLPGELKEAIFSVGTADSIYDICERNKIEDDRVSEIARYTGRLPEIKLIHLSSIVVALT